MISTPPTTRDRLFPERLLATVHYTGRVQGVGFRYETLRLAEGFEVAGWVENLADGRVRVVAEGAPAEVEAFLGALRGRLDGFIRGEERADRYGVDPEASGFSIR